MTFNFTEPHPSTATRRVNKAGHVTMGFSRGGAGNYQSFARDSISAGPDATGPASRVQAPSSSPKVAPKYALAGIGGAGNARPREERSQYDVDAEYQRLQNVAAKAKPDTATYHVGRGGAGNFHTETKSRQSSSSSITSSASDSSVRRAVGSARERLSRALSRE